MLGPILPRALVKEACANNSSELMYNVVCVKWLLLEFICFMHSLYKLSNRLVFKLNNILTRRPSLQKKVSSTFLSALHFKALSTFSSEGCGLYPAIGGRHVIAFPKHSGLYAAPSTNMHVTAMLHAAPFLNLTILLFLASPLRSWVKRRSEVGA